MKTRAQRLFLAFMYGYVAFTVVGIGADLSLVIGEARLYRTAPAAADPATGEIVPLHVCHFRHACRNVHVTTFTAKADEVAGDLFFAWLPTSLVWLVALVMLSARQLRNARRAPADAGRTMAGAKE